MKPYLFIYLFIYLLSIHESRSHGVTAQQCQEKRQEGKNKGGKRRAKKKWIGIDGETIHPNPGNLGANRGRRTEGN